MAQGSEDDVERVSVWQCIGCAKIEAPRPCVGVCEDRKVDIVYAFEYDAAMARAAVVRRQAAARAGFVRRFASTTPRDGQWEQSYRAFQEQARRILPALVAGDESELLRAAAAPAPPE